MIRLAVSTLSDHTAVCNIYGDRLLQNISSTDEDLLRIVLYLVRAPSDPGVPLFEKTRRWVARQSKVLTGESELSVKGQASSSWVRSDGPWNLATSQLQCNRADTVHTSHVNRHHTS